MQQIFSLGQRIQRFEDLLKGQDVLEKLEQLEQKMYQIQDDAKDKFEELNNEVADNSTRISSTENQNIEQGKQINISSFYRSKIILDWLKLCAAYVPNIYRC